MSIIRFYGPRDSYGCFSNFSKHPIVVNGITFLTSEHYFQSRKFEGTPYEWQIIRAFSPSEAAKMGRSRQYPLRQDWDQIKLNVMRYALYYKFTQHLDIQKILLDTQDAYIVEHTSRDSYWGDGSSEKMEGVIGPGENMLGRLLMELRNYLRSCPRD